MEQLICKCCGEYLGIRDKQTGKITVEESVKITINNEMIVCTNCDSTIVVKE